MAIAHRLEGRVFAHVVGHVRRQHLIDDHDPHQNTDDDTKAKDDAGGPLCLLIGQILLPGGGITADAQGLVRDEITQAGRNVLRVRARADLQQDMIGGSEELRTLKRDR